MRLARTVTITLMGLALLWNAPAISAATIGAADGWYKWQVDGTDTTFFLHQKDGEPSRIRFISPDCRVSWGNRNGVTGEVTDMGSLSLDDSVAILLDIATEKSLDRDVREEALFGLAQSDSDTAYAYLDELLFGN